MSEGALLRHSPSYREAALQPQGPRSTGKASPEQCFLVAGQNGFLLLIVSLVKEAVTHCLTPQEPIPHGGGREGQKFQGVVLGFSQPMVLACS